MAGGGGTADGRSAQNGAGGGAGGGGAGAGAAGGGAGGSGAAGGGAAGNGSGGAGGDSPFGGDQAGNGGGSGANGEFDRSLGGFDARMGKEQDAVARAGGGTAADQVLKEAGQAGGGGDAAAGGAAAGGAASAGGGASGPGGQAGNGAAGGSSSVGGQQAGAAGATHKGNDDVGPDKAPATVQGCNDTDKVARQLCEAATAENDPFLRASLWEEYNQYKKIVARQ